MNDCLPPKGTYVRGRDVADSDWFGWARRFIERRRRLMFVGGLLHGRRLAVGSDMPVSYVELRLVDASGRSLGHVQGYRLDAEAGVFRPVRHGKGLVA